MKTVRKASSTGSISTILLVIALSTLISSAQGQLGNGLMNIVNTANDAIARPLNGALGSITNPILSRGSLLGGNAISPLNPNIGIGALSGLATGAAAAAATSSSGGVTNSNLLGGLLGGGSSSAAAASAASAGGSSALLRSNGLGPMLGGGGGSSAAAASAASAGGSSALLGSNGFSPMLGGGGGSSAAAASAASAGGSSALLGSNGFSPMLGGGAGMGMGIGMGSSLASMGGAGLGVGMAAAAAAGSASAGMPGGLLGGSYGSVANAAAGAAAASPIYPSEVAGAALGAANAVNMVSSPAAVEGAVIGGAIAANQILGREALAMDAIGNSQAEAAIAGADMAAHAANNARSASLASNAYRQAKLAGARDRVNVAGTIQNTARISDAAIATHDSATKAEDSLLGSELAVDSAGTVLDSDAAYIPPVTSSLLRSLPYGRLGLRNILPRPLTYPSYLLPDVWLNGKPVNYLNVPLRQLQYGTFMGAAGQPFLSNNGILVNTLVSDPTLAYLSTNMNGVIGSSILPVLANGQLEAQDEIAMSRLITMQQQMGYGMGATYNGFSWANPVPMLTGSVSDANLIPTTTIGTTYPIGSALVIEPRDSYFQDYIDSSSSRQNYDERQQ